MRPLSPIAGRLQPLPAVFKELGIRRTKTYELIANGSLVAVKIGRRTLVTEASIETFKTSLPRATIGARV